MENVKREVIFLVRNTFVVWKAFEDLSVDYVLHFQLVGIFAFDDRWSRFACNTREGDIKLAMGEDRIRQI